MGNSYGVVVSVFCLASFGGVAAAQGFTADISLAEKNSALGRFPIENLTVGDTAVLEDYSTCWANGQLHVIGGMEVGKPKDDSFSVYATRVPGNSFTLEVKRAGSVNKDDFDDFFDKHFSGGDCEFIRGWNTQPGSLVPVASINEMGKVSELLALLRREIDK